MGIADLIANGGLSADQSIVNPIPHSGFAVLQVCLSYFETAGRYCLLPQKIHFKHGDKFKNGVLLVLPELASLTVPERDALLATLYHGARCGLYHASRTGPRVGLGQPPNGAALDYDSKEHVLRISPERLPKLLKRHLEKFSAELKDSANVQARQKFQEEYERDEKQQYG